MVDVSELKALDYRIFMKPNQVICYGVGEAFHASIGSMVDSGINIVGVIDKYRSGDTVRKLEKSFPVMSIMEAFSCFRTEVSIIITIADARTVAEVESELVLNGFIKERIYDLASLSMIMVPSRKSYCSFLGGYLHFLPHGLAKCCVGSIHSEGLLCEWFMEGKDISESIDAFLEKHSFYQEQSKAGRVPLLCKNCPRLTDDEKYSSTSINAINCADHEFCNADCVYCNARVSMPRTYQPLKSSEERFWGWIHCFEQLKKRGMLAKDAIIAVGAGEITINPYKDEIYRCLRTLSQHPILFASNGFIFDEGIAEILSTNKKSVLRCDLDAGTPSTYIKIKGFNRFSIVKENLKRYSEYGHIEIKYIVMPGWNDGLEEYCAMIDLLDYLNMNSIILAPEFGVSNRNEYMEIRKTCFSTAKFMVECEKRGITPILNPTMWKKEDMVQITRLHKELLQLQK